MYNYSVAGSATDSANGAYQKIGIYSYTTAGTSYTRDIRVRKYDSAATVTPTYGSEELGNWTRNGETYTARKLVTITTNKALTAYQVDLDYSQFNNKSMFFDQITNFDVGIGIQNTNETVNKTMTITLTGLAQNITVYSVSAKYNNTVVYTTSGTGNSKQFTFNTPVIAPLVSANNTQIPINITANVTVGSVYGWIANETQNVSMYYVNYVDIITMTESNGTAYLNMTMIPGANAIPTLSSYFTSAYGTKNYANGTLANISANQSLYIQNGTATKILPTHIKEDGVIFLDDYANVSNNLSFSLTPESTSIRTQNNNNLAVHRDYFVWITNSTNGTINGAANMSNLYNITFYDDISLAGISIDSVSNGYDVFFPDGTSKTFGIGYSGTGTIQNATMRAYPTWMVLNVSGNEIYTKSGFSTRSKFFFYTNTTIAQQNINMYLLNLSAPSAAYGIMNVLNNGLPISRGYIQVQKYYGSSGNYLNIDQKITNNNGQAGGYYTIDAYYKFNVYNSTQNLIYSSSLPEQFILTGGVYQITLSVAQNVSAAPTLNDFTGMWNTINYSLKPALIFYNQSTNVEFTVLSNASKVQYFGMNITWINVSGNSTLVYSNQLNNSTSGGSMIYTMNKSGVYLIQTYFKHVDYPEYDPLWTVQLGNMTGLLNAIERLKSTKPVSGFGWYFIALTVAMVVAGFVSRYTITGAGFAALAVLWIFSIMYAGIDVACIGGSLCLDSIGITSIASVMVFAGVYLGWYG